MLIRTAFRRIARKNRRRNETSPVAALLGGAESLENRTLLSAVFGDFNGDGYDDLATGVPHEHIGSVADAGAINVIYGTYAGLISSNDQDWQQNSPGVQGTAEDGDRFGEALAAGDFNNDGYIDLAIGVPGEDIGDVREAGAVQILYGTASGLVSNASGTARDDQFFHQDTAGIADMPERFDRFGSALASGDFNGDGIADLAIGIPGENKGGISDAGAVQILYGSNSGLTTNDSMLLFQRKTNVTGDDPEQYDFFGAALAAGDVDGDGIDDLAVGVPGEDVNDEIDAGAVIVYVSFGSAIHDDGGKFLHQDGSTFFGETAGVAEDFDHFGASLAIGDLNNDGRDDLAIGVPGEDIGSLVDAGAVNIVHSRQFFSSIATLGDSSQIWHQNSSGIVEVARANDLFGTSLAIADFDGDGDNDLAVGVPGKDTGSNIDTGGIHIIKSAGTNGLASSGDRFITQATAGISGTPEKGDAFGSWLAAGHVDPTGRADLAVTVPGKDVGGYSNAGGVAVLYGSNSANTFRTDNDQFWSQNSSYINGVSESNDHMGGVMPVGLRHDGLRVPQLQSNPGATHTIYLDFNGHKDSYFLLPIDMDGFDLDGNPEIYNITELAMIQDIWEAIAEDFAPFDVNVTTSSVGNGTNTERIVFGDRWQDNVMVNNPLQEGGAFGVSPHGAYGNPLISNTAYVFTESILNSNNTTSGARIGSIGSHEAGHGFGLVHKSDVIPGTNVVANEYSAGGTGWSPIMGTADQRSIWTRATMDNPDLVAFDIAGDSDIAELTGVLGVRADDHSSNVSQATDIGNLGIFGSLLVDTGIVENRFDVDTFVFDVTRHGSVAIDLFVNEVAANLDSRLVFGSVDTGLEIATHAPTDNLGARITSNVTPGRYFIKVKSENFFIGDVGQYTVRVQMGEALPEFRPGIGGIAGGVSGGLTAITGTLNTSLASVATTTTTAKSSKTAAKGTGKVAAFTIATNTKTEDNTKPEKSESPAASKAKASKIDTKLDTRALDVVFKNLDLF